MFGRLSFAYRPLNAKMQSSGIRQYSASTTKKWKNLVRFHNESGEVVYGDAILSDQGIKTAQLIKGDVWGDYTVTEQIENVKKILAPIQPTVIMCIGLNYKMHAKEAKMETPKYPVLFYKNLSATQNPGDPIVIPKIARDPPEVDYECELAIVIGKTTKNINTKDALQYVAGYTCANDVSARRWQTERAGSQWNFGKGFDTFCPLGPVIASPEVIPNPNALKISTVLNGETLQSSNTNDMIFDVPTIIQYLSQSTTLLPGTVILTGTPEGVGFARRPPRYLKAGDSVTIQIENIGKLTNPVIDE